MTQKTDIIKQEFKLDIQNNVQKNLQIMSGLAILILCYFVYSDIVIRDNIYASYTRLLPIAISTTLFVFNLFTKGKYKYLKFFIYNLLLISILIMMYAKYLVYLYSNNPVISVTGIILVIFLVSLELKTNLINTVLIYLLPIFVFVIVVIIFFVLPENKSAIILNMSNIFTMLILGFVINRIQYKLRYKLFKANFLLNQEELKTKELYKESLVMNENLQKKNEEIKEQKESIEEKNEELKEINVTKDKFFSIIAHDLRSPFNTMLGFSKLLVDNYENYEKTKQKEYISIVYQSINNAYKLLDNLLIWSQTQQDSIKFYPAKENLFLLLNETIDLLSQSAQRKLITIHNMIPRNICVHVDKNMVLTVFRNLISNAIKFTHIEGKVTIKVQKAESNKKCSSVEISVKDDGVGMTEEIQSKLFDLTKNTSLKGTENETGTGLGLVLCKEFVEKHGGKIWVESKEGKGSAFIFTLPMD